MNSDPPAETPVDADDALVEANLELARAEAAVDAARHRRLHAVLDATRDGYSYREIGSILGVSHTAVAKMVREAGRVETWVTASPRPAHERLTETPVSVTAYDHLGNALEHTRAWFEAVTANPPTAHEREAHQHEIDGLRADLDRYEEKVREMDRQTSNYEASPETEVSARPQYELAAVVEDAPVPSDDTLERLLNAAERSRHFKRLYADHNDSPRYAMDRLERWLNREDEYEDVPTQQQLIDAANDIAHILGRRRPVVPYPLGAHPEDRVNVPPEFDPRLLPTWDTNAKRWAYRVWLARLDEDQARQAADQLIADYYRLHPELQP